MGTQDNAYQLFGTPDEITLANGEKVKPGDRIFHEKYKYGTVVSFGKSGSSIYNLDVLFDNWTEIRVECKIVDRPFPPAYHISLWGSQDKMISKVIAGYDYV